MINKKQICALPVWVHLSFLLRYLWLMKTVRTGTGRSQEQPVATNAIAESKFIFVTSLLGHL